MFSIPNISSEQCSHCSIISIMSFTVTSVLLMFSSRAGHPALIKGSFLYLVIIEMSSPSPATSENSLRDGSLIPLLLYSVSLYLFSGFEQFIIFAEKERRFTMMESSATTTLNPAVATMRRLAVRTASSALDRMHHRHQNFAEYPYQEQMHTTQENFMGIFPMLKRIVYYLFVGAFLLATSMATYGIFYLMAMPAHAATEKLHFDYSCKNLASPSGEAPVCVGEAASSGQCQYSCSPSATVDIFATHTPWEALHPDVIPDAKSKTRILRPRKHYFLEVVLQLPESITNQQIGMFTVEVELQTKNNIPLARSKRSARLPHESGWIGAIRKSICLVPLLVGALTESRSAIIPSFRHFVESSKHPLVRI